VRVKAYAEHDILGEKIFSEPFGVCVHAFENPDLAHEKHRTHQENQCRSTGDGFLAGSRIFPLFAKVVEKVMPICISDQLEQIVEHFLQRAMYARCITADSKLSVYHLYNCLACPTV